MTACQIFNTPINQHIHESFLANLYVKKKESIETSPVKELLWWDSSLYQQVIELFFSLVPVVVLGSMQKAITVILTHTTYITMQCYNGMNASHQYIKMVDLKQEHFILFYFTLKLGQ